MKVKIIIDSDNYITGYAKTGAIKNSIEVEMDTETFEDFKSDFQHYKYEKKRLIKDTEKILYLEKTRVKEEITAHRDMIRETDTVNYNGHAQRYRKSDLSDIDYYQKRLEKTQKKAQEIENKKAIEENREPEEIILLMNWYFYDGSTMQLSVNEFDEILAFTDNPIEELYRKEGVLKARVGNMKTVEKLKKFNIENSWDNA